VLPRNEYGKLEPMAENLTKAKIERFVSAGIPADRTEAMLWDNAVTGLGLRARASGSCSWTLVYRPRGGGRKETARRVTLGQWPALTLDAARAAARAMVGEIALKKDPAMALRVERNREQRRVSKALDDYARSLQRRKIVNIKAVMSTLRRGLARFATREIGALTRKDLIGQIEALENAGKFGAATDLRSHARAWLEWAVSGGLVQFNVLAGLRRARSSRAERLDGQSKGKALSDPEVVALWNGIGAIGMIGGFGGLVRLGLLTGMRRNELSGLRWSDVRDDRIVLAPHATKTGAQHEIFLTVLMRNVLGAQMRTSSELIFPSWRTGGRMSGWTARVDDAVSASGVAFKLHDLRRTTRTLMSRLGVSRDTAELAIGHVKKDLIALYDFDDAWAARAEAFEKVSDHIASIIGASEAEGVIALPARARV
jgi:integrase